MSLLLGFLAENNFVRLFRCVSVQIYLLLKRPTRYFCQVTIQIASVRIYVFYNRQKKGIVSKQGLMPGYLKSR